MKKFVMPLPVLFPGIKPELVFENPVSLFDGCILRLPAVKAIPRYCVNRHEKVWDGMQWVEPSPCQVELYFDVFGELFSIVDYAPVVKDSYDIVFHADDYGLGSIRFASSIDWFRLERLQYGKLWVEVNSISVSRNERDKYTGEYICLTEIRGRVLSRYIDTSIKFEVDSGNRDLFSVVSEDYFKSCMEIVEEGKCHCISSTCGLVYAFVKCCLYENWSVVHCFEGREEYYKEEDRRDERSLFI